MTRKPGKVILLGAGPGAADLLTLRAAAVLSRADCILHDALVSPEILALAPSRCELIHVGKRKSQHSHSQEEINRLMFEAAKRHDLVVRLKGGDPFIFGRGGEEISFLQERGIEVEVIPGITAASAAAAHLKVPLTHRDFGQSVIFLSGYTRDTEDGLPEYDWKFLATHSVTLVFYMGLHNLDRIAAELLRHGMNEETPVALLSHLTLPAESIRFSDLKSTAQGLHQMPDFPALVVIGNVLRLYRDTPGTETAPERDEALVLLFHGSKQPESGKVPGEIVNFLQRDLTFSRVRFAFLSEGAQPGYRQVIADLAREGARLVHLWPLFLLPGKHLLQDIPAIPAEMRHLHPDLEIRLQPAPDLRSDWYPALLKSAGEFRGKKN